MCSTAQGTLPRLPLSSGLVLQEAALRACFGGLEGANAVWKEPKQYGNQRGIGRNKGATAYALDVVQRVGFAVVQWVGLDGAYVLPSQELAMGLEGLTCCPPIRSRP